MIIMAISCVIIFLAHPKTRPFIILLLIAAVLIAVGLYILYHTMESTTDFRLRRILTWLRPEENQETGGWQVLQGLYAVGSGGFFGKGLGNSTQKLSYIPEAQKRYDLFHRL